MCQFSESKVDVPGQPKETLKELLEKARESSPEGQQNIKVAFAEGYLAANSDGKNNIGGGVKVLKVFRN